MEQSILSNVGKEYGQNATVIRVKIIE